MITESVRRLLLAALAYAYAAVLAQQMAPLWDAARAPLRLALEH